MAIHIFCTGKTSKGRICKTSNALGAEQCSNCGTPFSRDKKYRVTVSVNGKRITKVLPNLTLAREWEKATKVDILRGDIDINNKPKKISTLGDVWAKYLPWAKGEKKTWITDEFNYKKHLEPRFGRKCLDTISPIDVERMKAEMKKATSQQGKPYAAATIKHQLVLLNRLFNLAKKWRLYGGDNPVDEVEMPKLDNIRTEFLTEQEAKKLAEVLDAWPCLDSVAFIRFTLLTGFRRSELFKLTWDDVYFDRDMVTLREPKGGKTITTNVSPEALDILRGMEVVSPYVFPGKDGGQRTDFKGPWKKIRKAACLPSNFRFHGLRHNFGSTLASAGVDLQVIQKLLCHKDYRTTLRYAHLSPGVIKDAAVKSGQLLSPPSLQQAEDLERVKK
jgi:integrase